MTYELVIIATTSFKTEMQMYATRLQPLLLFVVVIAAVLLKIFSKRRGIVLCRCWLVMTRRGNAVKSVIVVFLGGKFLGKYGHPSTAHLVSCVSSADNHRCGRDCVHGVFFPVSNAGCALHLSCEGASLVVYPSHCRGEELGEGGDAMAPEGC